MTNSWMKFVCGSVWISSLAVALAGAQSRETTTAWKDGSFHIDTAGLLARSTVILERPNLLANQAMPLGNGRLGAAVWSADGMTIQLNRVDTLPRRLSPGQVVLPGLTRLTSASDYSGQLDLYNGEFAERGGGMSARVYVQPKQDLLIVDVEGADPAKPQTVQLRLWQPRVPKASIHGSIGLLAEAWKDDKEPGASGRNFGSLSAVSAVGRNVSVMVTDPLTVTLQVTPERDGRFRVLIASPHYDGTEDALKQPQQAMTDRDNSAHREWWHAFWNRAGLIKVTSSDGAGEYMETLRNVYLFAAAAESGGEYPGSQAGIADLFSSVRDVHHWDAAAFWHWNLRMQVAANLGAGLFAENEPYFRLYRENLAGIEAWTAAHMSGHKGICVPETMRFNGAGIEYETWDHATTALNCDANFSPYYNARTLSTGAEVSLWIWQQYLVTRDRAFLESNFPVIEAAARFLLDYEKESSDGLRHTHPTNAHETQWDVTDSTNDICARSALYPVLLKAAVELHREDDLTRAARSALGKVPPLPRTQSGKALSLLPAEADKEEQDVIAVSYSPAAENHNVENIGLEPVWPFNLIGDNSPLFSLAVRTYKARPYPVVEDWSYDPIQAARLHMGDEVGSTLIGLTEKYQKFANGLADWGDPAGEFYVEQTGVVAAALEEALVQDYDGILRIAPAIPRGWDMDGTVYVLDRSKVDVQVRDGIPSTVVIEAGASGMLTLRNPWPNQEIRVTSKAGELKVEPARNGNLRFAVVAGQNYLVQRKDAAPATFAVVSGTAAIHPKTLGPVQIGIPAK